MACPIAEEGKVQQWNATEMEVDLNDLIQAIMRQKYEVATNELVQKKSIFEKLRKMIQL